MKKEIRYIIAVLATLVTHFCNSQTISSFSLGGDISNGNYNAVSANLRSEVKNDSSKIYFNTLCSYDMSYLTLKKQLLNSEFYFFSTMGKKMGSYKILIFNENEHSYNRKIIYRGNLGLGISYHVHTKHLIMDVSEALLAEAMLINSSLYDIRLSTRLKIQTSKSLLRFTSTTLIQPSIYTFPPIKLGNNFIPRSTSTIEINITKIIIIMGLGIDVSVQTYPAYIDNTVRPTDIRTYVFFKTQTK